MALDVEHIVHGSGEKCGMSLTAHKNNPAEAGLNLLKHPDSLIASAIMASLFFGLCRRCDGNFHVRIPHQCRTVRLDVQ